MTKKKRPTLPRRMDATAIADEVGKMIDSRELRPGDHLREKDLAERFQVSRGPVREALKILSSRSQVEIRPNLGATVPVLQPQDILEIHEIRGSVLRICAKWAAQRATDKELDAILAAAQTLKKLAAKGHVEDFLAQAYSWRRMVVAASHSKRLADTFATHGFGSIAQFVLTSSETGAMMQRIADLWLECSLALKARDRQTASRVIAKEYEHDQEQLERTFAGVLHALGN